MAISNLHDVYHDQLQDLYSACKQSLDVTTELAQAASNDDLKKALNAGAQGISDGMEKIAQLCNDHDIDPNGEHCKGMEGLVKEARAHGLDEDISDADARDAMIITQYQRMAHYAIAGYGCLRAFANRLDLDGDGAVLTDCLDASYEGDRTMTDIATGQVNRDAAA
ncbi:ferritin-like domain-containing protein [Hasllibacter sp. MH4015]|uniref:ferritin-like domain-containing protein n=1 Tax=Hasllibacter sp. MH4015 TaxID=2854029 RepID=UPI001CD2780A|nr:ferritin-like domain-containing protein [Hasllibacter sp. MH4015]